MLKNLTRNVNQNIIISKTNIDRVKTNLERKVENEILYNEVFWSIKVNLLIGI